MTNEFDNLEEDFPEQKTADVPGNEGDSSDLIGGSNAGTEYNMDSAPAYNKAPPRIDLNGKEVTIEDAKIILPLPSTKWDLTRDKTKDIKSCIFKLFYSIGGQCEFFSGLRVFRAEPKSEKYSHPSFPKDGVSQVSELFLKYAKFKKKDPNEITPLEFYSFLRSKPKARLKSVDVKNPVTNTMVRKNLVDEFLP